MIFIKHIFRWVLKFFKFPLQFIHLAIDDLKLDFSKKKENKKYNFIFIAGLPKSGTTLIENILRAVGYVDMRNSPLRVFDDRGLSNPHDISNAMFKLVPKNKHTFLKLHTHYSEENLRIIKKFEPKVIISLRNLHEVLISRYSHIIADKNHRHHNLIKNLPVEEGFKKSLSIQNYKNTPFSPIVYFKKWVENWKLEIEKKNLNYLVIDYESYQNNQKNYIKKILNYLDIDERILEEIHLKVKKNFIRHDKNNLEKNLNGFIKPQTINNDPENIKQKLNSGKMEEH